MKLGGGASSSPPISPNILHSSLVPSPLLLSSDVLLAVSSASASTRIMFFGLRLGTWVGVVLAGGVYARWLAAPAPLSTFQAEEAKREPLVVGRIWASGHWRVERGVHCSQRRRREERTNCCHKFFGRNADPTCLVHLKRLEQVHVRLERAENHSENMNTAGTQQVLGCGVCEW